MSKAIEDYLLMLFAIGEDTPDADDGIRSKDVADRMGISKASVSVMLRKLARLGYVDAEPYGRIHLTDKGFSRARDLMYTHRIIEVFLIDVLGFTPETASVHEEAHRLEHAFSPESIRRLDAYLNHPERTHTNKIIPRP